MRPTDPVLARLHDRLSIYESMERLCADCGDGEVNEVARAIEDRLRLLDAMGLSIYGLALDAAVVSHAYVNRR